MHRVRQSLPYYREFGWEPTVVAVHPEYVEGAQDPLLEKSLPEGLRVIRVKAFSSKYTRKMGLGSLALRSLFFYWRAVNRLLKKEHFDLVFFSTTQFPVLVLGNYWKRRFGIPYVIDMQDPWHTDYYLSKPKSERPPKYWFAYRLNKWLEPIAMRRVSALMSVSEAYLITLQERYSNIRPEMCHTITFGAFEKDFELVAAPAVARATAGADEHIHIVYVGRAGHDMKKAFRALFGGFRMGLEQGLEAFKNMRFHFIGTSYAADGKGIKTVEPLAEEAGGFEIRGRANRPRALFQRLATAPRGGSIGRSGLGRSSIHGFQALPLHPGEEALVGHLPRAEQRGGSVATDPGRGVRDLLRRNPDGRAEQAGV
ncbi:MAG: glycosyltransferase [Saprospirales bacterium]|nr:glycosyltransferase [Saprospirales bacterium]